MRATEIVRERDMALHGLGAIAGQAMDLAELLDAYVADLATRACEAHVTNSRQALARMQEELRVDAHGRSLDLHALRHTAASRFARHGAPLAVTQRILGYSDPKLTARVYVHLGVEEMRGVVEAAASKEL